MSTPKENYRKQLTSPKWQRRRLEIMQRDDFTCQKCGDTETELQVHHISYEKGKKAWEAKDENLVVLCKCCHQEIEILKNHNPYNEDTSYDKISIFKSVKFSDNTRFVITVCGKSVSFSAINEYDQRGDGFIIPTIYLKRVGDFLKRTIQDA